MLCIHAARRLLTGLALGSALAVLALAGEAAAQSCGHYVKVGGYRGDQAGKVAGVSDAKQTGTMARDEHPTAPRSCSGPNCSGLPDPAPPSPAPAPDSQVRIKLGIVPAASGGDAPATSSRIEDAAYADERDRPERLFRPPR